MHLCCYSRLKSLLLLQLVTARTVRKILDIEKARNKKIAEEKAKE